MRVGRKRRSGESGTRRAASARLLAMLASLGTTANRKASVMMYTNQTATPGAPVISESGCSHAAGAATTETCRYLRVLDRISVWIARARDAHGAAGDERCLLGELWLLHAELATALDHCPNARPMRDVAIPTGVVTQSQSC